jgi:hypothetical protein
MTPVEGTAVAVVGHDAVATATAALNLACAEARLRSVTVVDLIGDAPPLRKVLLTDDSHGVADCLAYGVSFAAVSRPTTADPHVSVIPSGSEPLSDADAFRSRRWERLIAQARERGTVIVFAALSSTPGLDALTSQVDRVIPHAAAVAPLASAAAPAPKVAAPAPRRPVRPRIGGPAAPRLSFVSTLARVNRRVVAVGGITLGILAFVALAWLVGRSSSEGSDGVAEVNSTPPRTDTLTSTAQLAASARAPSETPVMPIDPGDSTAASAFAIEIGHYPTYEAALRVLRQQIKRGAATITPLPDPAAAGDSSAAGGPLLMFVVYVGAARSAATMDSARRSWTATRDFPGGSVAETPYALRLTGRISADSARRATVAWRARGIPAYALDDGASGTVYAGAFATLDQAGSLTARLHAVGLAPIPAYRVGQAP